uniref:Uncharacterized protein n=1 Tax=Chromera velia CCMP2878 TaxID=1169474 RepID=A0A0G4GX99_9ALVE|eukprot:Cvel_23792.t1-p1 / transcript=Cvel_23792.t1 / gene=Cvel_23792 / organism=Chromera_velia_CCMP2878 / gene_product=hypothetical protein / transcript_product=hypothetical protein / location=Cvel_scaffold2497:4251-16476(+) / protein_length=2149 / sequence_SO=supercontig / SO=protein_coding / is_pseudo=false
MPSHSQPHLDSNSNNGGFAVPDPVDVSQLWSRTQRLSQRPSNHQMPPHHLSSLPEGGGRLPHLSAPGTVLSSSPSDTLPSGPPPGWSPEADPVPGTQGLGVGRIPVGGGGQERGQAKGGWSFFGSRLFGRASGQAAAAAPPSQTHARYSQPEGQELQEQPGSVRREVSGDRPSGRSQRHHPQQQQDRVQGDQSSCRPSSQDGSLVDTEREVSVLRDNSNFLKGGIQIGRAPQTSRSNGAPLNASAKGSRDLQSSETPGGDARRKAGERSPQFSRMGVENTNPHPHAGLGMRREREGLDLSGPRQPLSQLKERDPRPLLQELRRSPAKTAEEAVDSSAVPQSLLSGVREKLGRSQSRESRRDPRHPPSAFRSPQEADRQNGLGGGSNGRMGPSVPSEADAEAEGGYLISSPSFGPGTGHRSRQRYSSAPPIYSPAPSGPVRKVYAFPAPSAEEGEADGDAATSRGSVHGQPPSPGTSSAPEGPGRGLEGGGGGALPGPGGSIEAVSPVERPSASSSSSSAAAASGEGQHERESGAGLGGGGRVHVASTKVVEHHCVGRRDPPKPTPMQTFEILPSQNPNPSDMANAMRRDAALPISYQTPAKVFEPAPAHNSHQHSHANADNGLVPLEGDRGDRDRDRRSDRGSRGVRASSSAERAGQDERRPPILPAASTHRPPGAAPSLPGLPASLVPPLPPHQIANFPDDNHAESGRDEKGKSGGKGEREEQNRQQTQAEEEAPGEELRGHHHSHSAEHAALPSGPAHQRRDGPRGVLQPTQSRPIEAPCSQHPRQMGGHRREDSVAGGVAWLGSGGGVGFPPETERAGRKERERTVRSDFKSPHFGTGSEIPTERDRGGLRESQRSQHSLGAASEEEEEEGGAVGEEQEEEEENPSLSEEHRTAEKRGKDKEATGENANRADFPERSFPFQVDSGVQKNILESFEESEQMVIEEEEKAGHRRNPPAKSAPPPRSRLTAAQRLLVEARQLSGGVGVGVGVFSASACASAAVPPGPPPLPQKKGREKEKEREQEKGKEKAQDSPERKAPARSQKSRAERLREEAILLGSGEAPLPQQQQEQKQQEGKGQQQTQTQTQIQGSLPSIAASMVGVSPGKLSGRGARGGEGARASLGRVSGGVLRGRAEEERERAATVRSAGEDALQASPVASEYASRQKVRSRLRQQPVRRRSNPSQEGDGDSGSADLFGLGAPSPGISALISPVSRSRCSVPLAAGREGGAGSGSRSRSASEEGEVAAPEEEGVPLPGLEGDDANLGGGGVAGGGHAVREERSKRRSRRDCEVQTQTDLENSPDRRRPKGGQRKRREGGAERRPNVPGSALRRELQRKVLQEECASLLGDALGAVGRNAQAVVEETGVGGRRLRARRGNTGGCHWQMFSPPETDPQEQNKKPRAKPKAKPREKVKAKAKAPALPAIQEEQEEEKEGEEKDEQRDDPPEANSSQGLFDSDRDEKEGDADDEREGKGREKAAGRKGGQVKGRKKGEASREKSQPRRSAAPGAAPPVPPQRGKKGRSPKSKSSRAASHAVRERERKSRSRKLQQEEENPPEDSQQEASMPFSHEENENEEVVRKLDEKEKGGRRGRKRGRREGDAARDQEPLPPPQDEPKRSAGFLESLREGVDEEGERKKAPKEKRRKLLKADEAEQREKNNEGGEEEEEGEDSREDGERTRRRKNRQAAGEAGGAGRRVQKGNGKAQKAGGRAGKKDGDGAAIDDQLDDPDRKGGGTAEDVDESEREEGEHSGHSRKKEKEPQLKAADPKAKGKEKGNGNSKRTKRTREAALLMAEANLLAPSAPSNANEPPEQQQEIEKPSKRQKKQGAASPSRGRGRDAKGGGLKGGDRDERGKKQRFGGRCSDGEESEGGEGDEEDEEKEKDRVSKDLRSRAEKKPAAAPFKQQQKDHVGSRRQKEKERRGGAAAAAAAASRRKEEHDSRATARGSNESAPAAAAAAAEGTPEALDESPDARLQRREALEPTFLKEKSYMFDERIFAFRSNAAGDFFEGNYTRLVLPQKDLRFSKPSADVMPAGAEANFELACSHDATDFCSLVLRLPGGMKKNEDASQEKRIFLDVMRGEGRCLEVVVAGRRHVLSKGQQALIPPRHTYTLENLSRREVDVLLYIVHEPREASAGSERQPGSRDPEV